MMRRTASKKSKGVSRPFALGTGWVPEEPDPRDFTHESESIAAFLERVGIASALRNRKRLPARADLTEWCPPVRFQGGYNDCAANVVAELIEFFQKKAFGKSTQASRLFLYKVAKSLLGVEGNSGVYIRQVMGVLKLVGVPPEKYWPYLETGTLAKPATSDPRLDSEPTALCYALAQDYKAVSYYRFDISGQQNGAGLLRLARAHLAAQIPFAFGFPLFESLKQSMKTGKVPYPRRGEKRLGNHAVLAVGYDDRVKIRNKNPGSPETVGALRVQNSWGEEWGRGGFGWIPYEFVTRGHARDFWTLIRADWVDTGQFQLQSPTA